MGILTPSPFYPYGSNRFPLLPTKYDDDYDFNMVDDMVINLNIVIYLYDLRFQLNKRLKSVISCAEFTAKPKWW